MRIFETYSKRLVNEFWKGIEEVLEISEDTGALNDLLSQANTIIFNKFGINPKDKVYFIGGSARLYLYPKLREAFELNGEIGDLDIIIPDEKYWIQAGLGEQYTNGGIYRPKENELIEAFNIWDPSKAGGEYADFHVRSTQEIMADCSLINGYYYMGLPDIIDYKTNLNREKEVDVVNLFNSYLNSNMSFRKQFLRRMVNIIGLDNTKEFVTAIKR